MEWQTIFLYVLSVLIGLLGIILKIMWDKINQVEIDMIKRFHDLRDGPLGEFNLWITKIRVKLGMMNGH